MGYSNGDSRAKQLKKQYENLVSSLDYDMPKLLRDYRQVDDLINNGFKDMGDFVSNCLGELSELLVDRKGHSKIEFDSLLLELGEAIESLKNKQRIAKSRLGQLKWYCQQEEYKEIKGKIIKKAWQVWNR